MIRLIGSVLVASAVAISGAAQAQQYVMMPDSTNNRMVLFNTMDGSVVNDNFFGLQAGTPIHGLQVGNQIWVSEQLGDRVSRWDFNGNHLGDIGGQFPGGGLDNIRGMAFANGTVYVSNAGTANDAPGQAIVMFDTSGNLIGNFSTAGLASSPFAILEHQGSLLVASSNANDDIHRFSFGGSSMGTFHNSTSLNFTQQLAIATNGDILAAGFSSPAGVVRLDPNTGDIVGGFTASGTRGVFQLGNGNILWSNSAGAHVYNMSTGSSTQVYAGGGRHFGLLVIPGPGVLAFFGLAGMTATRRRRQ